MILQPRDESFQRLVEKKFPELIDLERVIASLDTIEGVRATAAVEATVTHENREFPLYSVVIGSPDKTAPTLGLFGGVHGLERVGSEVVINFLKHVIEQIRWDQTFRDRLRHSRLVFMPIINPVGIFLTRRSNGNGVDLMRNSPVTAEAPPPFLLGGQTYSSRLPWFRGRTDALSSMEVEARAVCDFVAREVAPAKCSFSVDVHSGFGAVDRLWFPYAKSQEPPPILPEVMAVKQLLDRTYPHHVYQIEPQAVQYTTHGDLWDWLLDQHLHAKSKNIYIPWTLELGSWLWLRKNPRQAFSSLGAFNPVRPHRLRRVLRRHLTLFDFLHRALLSADAWTSKISDAERGRLVQLANEAWYEP